MKFLILIFSTLVLIACNDSKKSTENSKTFSDKKASEENEEPKEMESIVETPPVETPRITSTPDPKNDELITSFLEKTKLEQLIHNERLLQVEDSHLLHFISQVDVQREENKFHVRVTTSNGQVIPFKYTHKSEDGIEFTSNSDLDRLVIKDFPGVATLIRIYNTETQSVFRIFKVEKKGKLFVNPEWFVNENIDSLEFTEELTKKTFAAFRSFLEHVVIIPSAQLTVYYVAQTEAIPATANRLEISLGEVIRFQTKEVAHSLAQQNSYLEMSETSFHKFELPQPKYSDQFGIYWHQPNIYKTAFSQDKDSYANFILLEDNKFESVIKNTKIQMVWQARSALRSNMPAYEFPVEFIFED